MFSKICGYKSYWDKEVWFDLDSVMLCFLKVKKKKKKTQRNEVIEDKAWNEDEWTADVK